MHFLCDTAGLLPEEAKSQERVSWAQGAGRVSQALGGGEWFDLQALMCPGISGQQKWFCDFKLCIESQSSEFSQTEGWVSSPAASVKQKPESRQKQGKEKAKLRVLASPWEPLGASLTGPTQESLFRNSPLLRQQTCAEACCGPPAPMILVPIPHLMPSMSPEESRAYHHILPCERLNIQTHSG